MLGLFKIMIGKRTHTYCVESNLVCPENKNDFLVYISAILNSKYSIFLCKY